MGDQAFGRYGGELIEDTEDREDVDYACIHTVPFGASLVIEIIEGNITNIDGYQGATLAHPFSLVGKITRLKLSAGKCQAYNAWNGPLV